MDHSPSAGAIEVDINVDTRATSPITGRRQTCPTLITIDCHELTVDEQLALAGEITGSLKGRAVALVRDEDIVLDQVSPVAVEPEEVRRVVRDFVSRRKDSEHYSVEGDSDNIIVHSADPLARGRGRRGAQLPPNLLRCPFCSFVTPYQEMYAVHVRSHGFAAPM